MTSSSPNKTHSPTLVEMFTFEYRWLGRDGDNKNDIGKILSTITIRPKISEDNSLSGFCDITLIRKNYNTDNFEINSSYYYLHSGTIVTPRSRKAWERNLAKGLIWTRFAELARMAAVSAGSNPYDIPLAPDKVNYTE